MPTPPTRKSSSVDDLDKPQPPKRYSHSTLLSSFRGNKRPGYVARTTAASSQEDQGDVVYHHARTQSLPTSKIVATRLSSKSWVMNDGGGETQNEGLPRSSSFSRARVIETSSVQTVRSETRPSRRSDAGGSLEVSVKTVQRDDTKAPMYAAMSDVKYNRGNSQTGVIQALRTGEVTSEFGDGQVKASPKHDEQVTNNNKWNKQEYNKKPEESKPVEYKVNKPDKPKPEVQPKSILKREASKPEPKKNKAPKPVPVLKENSLMQQLLQESQGQGGSSERSTAAAIEEEINQRTGKTSNTVKSTFDLPKTAAIEQHQRLVVTLLVNCKKIGFIESY